MSAVAKTERKAPRLIGIRELVLLAIIIALLSFFIFSGREKTIWAIVFEFSIFAIITLSLNLETGFTGIPQFGRVAAVITGAFAVGALPGRLMAYIIGEPWGAEYANAVFNYRIVPVINELLASNIFYSIGFLLLCLFTAAVFGAAIGWLISRPAIRLKEAYLGISLLAFGDFFMWVGHNWNIMVGGSTPINVPDPFRIFGGDRFMAAVLVLFFIAIVIYIYLERLTKSPFGRNLKMIRDNEVSASAAGLDVVKVRTRSLVIGSAIAAMGGGLYVIYTGSIGAIGFQKLTFTFWPWAYMMLGGIGSNFGVLMGVMLLVILKTMIIVFRYDWFAFMVNVGIDPMWLEFTLMGAVIVLVILFVPHGLVPEKVEPVLPEERVKRVLAKRQLEKTSEPVS